MDTDIAVQTYLKAVFRSSKLEAHVMTWLKLKNIVLSEKKSDTDEIQRIPFKQVKYMQYHYHYASLRIQIHLNKCITENV